MIEKVKQENYFFYNMVKVKRNLREVLFPELTMRKTHLIALIAILAAVSNAIMFLSFPITLLGITSKIHFIQIPILTAAFGIGPFAGLLVGIIGAISMVFSVIPPNPFIVLYNGLLGFFAGIIYLILRRIRIHKLLAQVSAMAVAFLIQMPFIWTLNTIVMGIPSSVVQVILIKLLLEDLASTLINHPILYRINLVNAGRGNKIESK